MSEPKKYPRWELPAFVLPGAPLLALSLPPLIFLPPYYSQHIGIPVEIVGLLFVAARVFDLVLNPTIGGWQDRTVHSFGRRRLWMVATTPVLMLAVWAAFIGMPVGAPALLAWLIILSFYASFASMMIAHLGWAGELRPTYHERTQVLGALQIASTLGQIGMLVLPAAVNILKIGTFVDGVHLMGWTIIVSLPICVAICVFTVKERPAPPSAKMGFAQAMKALQSNDALRRILLPDFLIGVTQGVSGGLFLFFFKFVLGFGTQAEALLLLYFIASLAGVPLWVYLGKRLGKHRALQIACVWWAIALALIPLVPKGNLALAAFGMFFAGVANGATVFLLRAMMADVVDEDQAVTGEQRSGLFFGLLLTTTKVGLALGPATYVVLGLFGFDPKLGAENSPQAIGALVAMFAGAPLILNLLTAWSLNGYPLTEARQASLREAISARDAGRVNSQDIQSPNTDGPSTR
jgi:Na+/melibiose symporter-like transporter